MQYLPLYTSFLFSMPIDIVDIERPDGVCSFTFVVDDILGLVLHTSDFSDKD